MVTTSDQKAELLKRLDTLTGYLMITDTRAHILYASKGLQDKRGLYIEKIIGKTPGELWGHHMDNGFYTNMWDTLQNKKLPFIGTVRNRTINNTVHDEILHILPVTDSSGEIEYYIEVEPNFKSERDRIDFEKEFTHGADTQLLHRVWSWISGSKKQSTQIENELFAFAKGINEPSTIIDAVFVSDHDKQLIQEEHLIAQAQINHELYGGLYLKYRKKLFYYFFHHLGGDFQQAEDLTEETFTHALAQFNHFKIGHISYASYLLSAAHNILVNHYRKRKTISLEKFPNISLDESFSFIRKIEFALIWQKIRNLSPLEQKILVMRYQDDLAIAQIARLLLKSENSIKLMLSRAQRKLRKLST